MYTIGKFLLGITACAVLGSAPVMAQQPIAVNAQTLNNVHLVAGVFGGSLRPDASGVTQWKIGLRLASPLSGATTVTTTVTQNLPAAAVQQAINRPGAGTTVDLTCPTVRVMAVAGKVIASGKDCRFNSYKA